LIQSMPPPSNLSQVHFNIILILLLIIIIIIRLLSSKIGQRLEEAAGRKFTHTLTETPGVSKSNLV
jgi:hypothetical protein